MKALKQMISLAVVLLFAQTISAQLMINDYWTSSPADMTANEFPASTFGDYYFQESSVFEWYLPSDIMLNSSLLPHLEAPLVPGDWLELPYGETHNALKMIPIPNGVCALLFAILGYVVVVCHRKLAKRV